MTDKAGDSLRGLSTRLIVLFLAMVVAGFVIPSPGGAAPRPVADPPRPATPSLYKPMAAPSNPVELLVPSLRISAPVLPISLVGSVLTPPSDASDVGWWDASAAPGARKGQTVITGHTVHTGGGVMDRLGQIRAGALVQLKTERALMNYEATRVIVYTKAELAEHATELFRQDRVPNRLVLITCTGWTGSEYTSNVVVFADPLGVRRNAPRISGNAA